MRTRPDAPIAVLDGDAALARVLELPRREPATEELIAALSRALRVRPDDESAMLRAPQVEALREIWEYGGLFAPMRVGAGKSLVTLLAPTILHSERPVLVIPASLKDKTKRDFVRYRRDWLVRLPELISYEELGRPDREHLLTDLAPDLLMLDEAHHVRNLDSARTRRIGRYVAAARKAA